MKINIIVLLIISLTIIALDPQWAFLICCLLFALIILTFGERNE